MRHAAVDHCAKYRQRADEWRWSGGAGWPPFTAASQQIAGADGCRHRPYLFGGTVIVERIYGYPGLGKLPLTVFSTRNAILLQGVAMLLAAITAMCWLIADIFVAWVNSRRMRP